jgi:putative hydrolase of the HAD superfamily
MACGEWLGVSVEPEIAADFAAMFAAAGTEYATASRTRDPERLRGFWRDLHAAWLGKHGLGREHAEAFVATAEEIVYSPLGHWFQPYPDVAPCLERLRAAGLRLAVVSNWDSSLARILRAHDLHRFFDVILASLEEGVEKPAPEIFRRAMDVLRVQPADTVHVGDDPVDDLEGARRAGIRAIWVDRESERLPKGAIRTLDELAGALGWSG